MGLLTSGTYYFLGFLMMLGGMATYSFFSIFWQSVAVASCGCVIAILGFIQERREKAETKKHIELGRQLNHYNTLIALGHSKEDAMRIAENEETITIATKDKESE